MVRKRIGARQPVSLSRVSSARSSSTSTRPDQSRTVITGAAAVVEAESTKQVPPGATVTAWSRSSSVIRSKPEPSRPTRHTVRRYGSSSTRPEAVRYTVPSASSTCRSSWTAKEPEVTALTSAPVEAACR
ncbi:hypothetical protein STENM327S_05156 [Streptomyces tendae]